MSRIFEHGNWTHNSQCPICGTTEDKKVVLIGIAGTQDGYNIEAVQAHLDCLLDSLRYYPDGSIIGTITAYPPREQEPEEAEHED